MPSIYPIKLRLLALIVIVCGLISGALLLKESSVFAPGLLENNPITIYEKRFEKLKEILPLDCVVGYEARESSNKIWDTMKYNHTQYTLAPRIVVRDSDLQFVVVNTYDERVVSKLRLKGYRTEKDFRNGVLLMKKWEDQ